MKNLSTLSTLILPAVLALAACGGSSGGANGNGTPVGDKQGAADAAYRVQNTNDAVHGQSGRGLAPAAAGDLPDVSGAETKFTVQGQAGSAEITEKASVGDGAVRAEFTVKYMGYSSDGESFLDGEVTEIADVSTDMNGADVSTELRGTLELTGKVESHLEMNVTTHVSVSGTSASVALDGTITADGTTYQYDGDRFDFAHEAF